MKKNLLLLSLLLVCFSMGGSRATVVNPGDEATASAACQSTATQIATLKSYVKALKAQVASIESQIQQIYGEHYATGEPLNKVEINALKMAKRFIPVNTPNGRTIRQAILYPIQVTKEL